MATAPVTAPDIQNGVTTGNPAATLINDEKRAINEIIEETPPIVTTEEAEAGIETEPRLWPPEQVAQAIAALGSNGPAVLKDWTATTTLSLNLFDGVDFGANGFEFVEVQIRRFTYSGSGSGSLENNVNLRMFNTGRVAPSTVSSRGINQNSEGTQQTAGPDFFQMVRTSFGVSSGEYSIKLVQNPTAFMVGYLMTGLYLPGSFTGLVGSVYMRLNAAFRDTAALPTELWLEGETGETISYEYRIIRN